MVHKIYKIINDINDKVYVGKTFKSLEERFSSHKRDSLKREEEKRPLYNAINKYGSEHFSIELIEDCDENIVNQREIYWIEHYHGYSQGYNATLGGDGKTLYNHNEIVDLIEDGHTVKEIVELIQCCPETVRNIAKAYNLSIIKIDSGSVKEMKDRAIKVDQFDLKNNYVQTFDSYADGARWLKDNNYVNGNLSGVRAHIGSVCKGDRKTAYKFIWKYAE